MPNALAYLMLMIWPLVCIKLFQKLSLERAIIWSLLGGYLILPPVAEFDLPLVPSMNKDSISSVSACLACIFVAHKSLSFWPQLTSVRLLLIAFVVGAVPTILTNRDPLIFEVLANSDPITFETYSIPGLGLRDILSVLIGQFIVLIPFFLARQFLATAVGQREIIIALGIGGLIYSIPALIETLVSPLINIFVYGFFQHDFNQMIRENGFRPIVFLPHGLWLALFMVTVLLSVATLARHEKGEAGRLWAIATVYMFFVLVACKSFAAIAYGIALTPLVLLATQRTKVRLAALMALIAISYPMLRNAGLIPLEAILDYAGSISAERAQSLDFRFDNEELLLDRAHEKPWFGWGGWGRNLQLHPETGDILTIPDGNWIIVFGSFGWLGYIAQMGLLSAPIAHLSLKMRTMKKSEMSPYVATITIILAATMMDMLLNATLTPFTWLCAGAVLGYVEKSQAPKSKAEKPPLFGKGPVIGRSKMDASSRSVM